MSAHASDSRKAQTNWAGNVTFSAERMLVPTTIEEAQEAVRAASKVRVIGSRHCFNDIADTIGTHLSLERFRRVLSLDKARGRTTVEGGIRYSDLGPYLHGQGYALHNTASFDYFSVVGACATATHGSGALGNLATAVAMLEFINAEGDLVTLSREKDGDTFAGAVVNLGGLGVVTKLRLDLRPAFNVRQDVYRDLPVAALVAHFAEIMSSGYSVSIFTDWRGDTVTQVWIKSAVDAGKSFAVKDSLLGAWPATENMHPLAGADAADCSAQMGIDGPSYDRLPHFRAGFEPAAGDELQVEYYVPEDHAVAAIQTLHRLGDRLAPVLKVSEIRTIAADDLWMSPCYRQPCVAFHFSFRQNWPALKQLLPGVEEALAPFHPRPHWGKLFTMPPATVQACYEMLPAFRDLLDAHDPTGKFRNAYLERNVFGRF